MKSSGGLSWDFLIFVPSVVLDEPVWDAHLASMESNSIDFSTLTLDQAQSLYENCGELDIDLNQISFSSQAPLSWGVDLGSSFHFSANWHEIHPPYLCGWILHYGFSALWHSWSSFYEVYSIVYITPSFIFSFWLAWVVLGFFKIFVTFLGGFFSPFLEFPPFDNKAVVLPPKKKVCVCAS